MLGPFITTTEEKTQRLAEEGVVAQDGTVALERFGFHDFSSDRPLEKLRQIQEDIQARIVLRPRRRIPKYIGGVDVAYPNAEEGVAAYALVETATGRLEWSTTVRRRVVFPYISTYLGFREIPILLDLLDEVREAGRMAEVLMVDGSGILHHRHAGVASHLGVVASLPMKPGESRPVWEKRGQVQFVRSTRRAVPANCTCPLFSQIGISLRPTAGSARPIFISPGHRVDLPFCEQLVRRFLTGRRLPEPIYWADRLSKRKVTL
jgi:deoxyribonuclease V